MGLPFHTDSPGAETGEEQYPFLHAENSVSDHKTVLLCFLLLSVSSLLRELVLVQREQFNIEQLIVPPDIISSSHLPACALDFLKKIN